MYKFNFVFYNKDAEKPGGDYWAFLDATAEDIEKDDVFLDSINTIIHKITNNGLKQKMKEKLFDLIMANGVEFRLASGSFDLFSSEELKQIFETDFNRKIAKLNFEPNQIKYHLGGLVDLMYLFTKVNDPNWEYSMITRIMDLVKENTDKTMLVNLVERNKYRNDIYNRLISDYYEYFPDVYKNYLKMQQDSLYIYKKSMQFVDQNLDIGIDPLISIGPEIEANNDYDIHIDVSSQSGFENYTCTTDATVYNGDEVSPRTPFHNIKEDIMKFCGLCEAMKDIGYYYNDESRNASGQINLGLDYLDSKEAILNFYEIYGNCEELLYYICNGEGQLFRQEVYSTSRIKPISEIIGKRILDESLTRDDVIKLFNNRFLGKDNAISGLQYKKNSVCLRGNNSEDYRLEFRIPNGGCNYQTWLDNIRLFGKMFEVSKRLADAMKKEYLSSEEEKLLGLKLDLQDINLSFEEKLKILMDLLFKDDSIKQIYYDRFVNTIKKIKETNNTRYMDIYGSLEPGFDEVEFLEQYQSRLDPDYEGRGIIEYDPETDTMSYGRKK